VLIFKIYKELILNLWGEELITCLQILNRTLNMCSYRTLNYDCAKLSQPFNDHQSHYSGSSFFCYDSPAATAR